MIFKPEAFLVIIPLALVILILLRAIVGSIMRSWRERRRPRCDCGATVVHYAPGGKRELGRTVTYDRGCKKCGGTGYADAGRASAEPGVYSVPEPLRPRPTSDVPPAPIVSMQEGSAFRQSPMDNGYSLFADDRHSPGSSEYRHVEYMRELDAASSQDVRELEDYHRESWYR